MTRLRVGIADDSSFFREVLRGVLEAEGDIEVVAEAESAEEAVRAAEKGLDLLTLDVQMPRVSGLEAIEQVMAKRPLPILVLTAQPAGPDSELAFEALRRGALEIVSKRAVAGDAAALRGLVRKLSQVRVVRHLSPRTAEHPHPSRQFPAAAPLSDSEPRRQISVIGIGASTGGPEALARILSGLPADFHVPIAIVQHLPPGFVDAFARFLQGASALRVVVASGAVEAKPGTVVIAGDGGHLVASGRRRLEVAPEPANVFHRPSVDALLASLAETSGGDAVGVLLTGMGDDGARGMTALRRSGALTVAQDQHSCSVYGMPRAAILSGGAQRVLPLDAIAGALLDAVTATAS